MEENNKIKNLISLSIILAGLLIGSLFVDLGQLIKGHGYSKKNLNASDIFEADGKTWVAYSEPAVPISVITDDDCENCDPGEILAWLRRVSPTISAEKIDYDSEKGESLVDEFGIKALPAFIFDKSLEETEFFKEAEMLFYPRGDKYILNVQTLGAPVGKYLELPKINSEDPSLGFKDAEIQVITFIDFQCPYSKVFYSSLRSVMKNYQDKVLFGFKQLPLTEIHSQAENAALASMCAGEQEKFWEYADVLFAKQGEWGGKTDSSIFKAYAQNLGLKSDDFSSCLDNNKYRDKIASDFNEAQDFGITGTPTVFIGEKVETGVLSADELKASIEDELKK